MENREIKNERIDDIPLLLEQIKEMRIQELLDKHIIPHKNWEGASVGWVSSIWLSHILSEASHKMNHVEEWATYRIESLRKCTGEKIQTKDFTDDRLASILRLFSNDTYWKEFETALNQNIIRIYELTDKTIRLDSTTANSYCNPEGMFQFGHSKDRSDLPQIKIMMSSIDPLGMPLTTAIVEGNKADDPLYIPTIKQVRTSLGRKGLLYVGDCKMGALETRAFIAKGGDFYLCPLPATQVLEIEPSTQTQCIERGKEIIATGYEVEKEKGTTLDGKPFKWKERQLIVRSFQYAKASEHGLKSRLEKATEELLELNKRGKGKRFPKTPDELKSKIEGIITHYRVKGILQIDHTEEKEERRVRPYKGKPQRVDITWRFSLQVTINPTALESAVEKMGWKVYVTNAPKEQMPLEDAVLAYRNEYLIERVFGRLKGKTLSLSPMYVERDDHATGLVRLLSIGVRVLTLLEFVVRKRLAEEQRELFGLYAGNPKRATARPTTERLLRAFHQMTWTLVRTPNEEYSQVTPLSKLQQDILGLLGFSMEVYTQLCDVKEGVLVAS